MLQLVYISTATSPLSDDALRRLLVEARDLNNAAGITGLLLHHDGSFVQALEGPETSVRETFNRIQADSRHQDLMTLYISPIDSRDFGRWEMGYVPIDPESAEQVDGFTSVVAHRDDDGGSRAKALLMLFADALV